MDTLRVLSSRKVAGAKGGDKDASPCEAVYRVAGKPQESEGRCGGIMSNSRDNTKLINLRVTAERYGFSLATLRRLASERKVPIIKLGKSVFIDVEVFDKWLAEHRIDAQNPRRIESGGASHDSKP